MDARLHSVKEEVSLGELPDPNYTKLLSKLGNKGTAIGAALLNCGIVTEDSGWKLASDLHSPSLTYLKVPQNRNLLSKAMEELWGLKDCNTKQSASKLPDICPEENSGAEDPSITKDKTPKGSIIADTDRIIKLLGAEVLYIKDANGESDTDDFGSAD